MTSSQSAPAAATPVTGGGPGPASAATDRAPARSGYTGTRRLLCGMVLAVLTYWLFAGSMGTVAPAIMENINAGETTYVDATAMNLAVSVTALFSGLFIVMFGGFADRFGRVKVTLIGIALGVVGSALLIFAAGSLALPLLLAGRAFQGLAAACIMPATMALVKTYWEGAARQAAVSWWSIGSWGGSGASALFGGFAVNYVGWRGIFIAYILISLVAFALIWGTPESRAEQTSRKGFDVLGLALFVVGTLGLMIVLLFGSRIGWTSATTLALAAVAIVAFVAFIAWERRQSNPFIDLKLFSNTTFTGATISNFLLNATIGMLMVSQQLVQLAGFHEDGTRYTAWEAGLLTIGYAVCIIAFIKVGEKLLQRYGARKPMIWGSLIVLVAAALLMATNVMLGTYLILAIIAYCLFGIGLAFYATPSTDAALSNLPAAQAGSGSGIYKMASSLGGAIGAAVSLAVFTGVSQAQGQIVGGAILMEGRQDNLMLREGGMMAIGVNVLFLVLAILSIVMTVPKGGGSKDLHRVAASASPSPQPAPDEERSALLAEFAALPTEDLRALRKQAMLRELGDLDEKVLHELIQERRG